MSKELRRSEAHRHECAECRRSFSCSKAHTVLDGGRFGLHPRCAGRLVLPESGPIRIFQHPPRQLPPAEPVTGAPAILARALGRYGGPCLLDVLVGAYGRERLAYGRGEMARFRDESKRIEKDARDLVARIYGEELKRRGKGKWHAAARAAMNRGREIGLVPFEKPGTVKTHFSRLHPREKRAAV